MKKIIIITVTAFFLLYAGLTVLRAGGNIINNYHSEIEEIR